MPRMEECWFGRIKSIVKPDGTPYEKTNYRLQYIDDPGLIILYTSLHKCPGKRFFYILPNFASMVDYFHSASGDWEPGGVKDTLLTGESFYTLTREENCLPNKEKLDLILKAVGEGYFPGSFLVTAKKMVDELEKKIEEERRK